MDVRLQVVWSGVRNATVTGTRLQNIQTESGFLLGGDTWNNAVFTLSIILYSDTAVATVANREYWEKPVSII